MLESDGRLHRVGVAHVDPAMAEVLSTATGYAPLAYDQALRVEEAHDLLLGEFVDLLRRRAVRAHAQLRAKDQRRDADTDFVVEVTDVAPDGTSRQVGRGWLNAARAFSRSNPQPLVPGARYHFSVEVWPTSYVFPAGHRIRVDLSGSDCCVLGADPNPLPAGVTVYQDAAHPSHLEVPVIGAVAAQSLRGRPAARGR